MVRASLQQHLYRDTLSNIPPPRLKVINTFFTAAWQAFAVIAAGRTLQCTTKRNVVTTAHQ
jgi:hypothetical protein